MSLPLHEIAEVNHRILDPFTDAQLMEVGEVARVEQGTRVLDLACGKGEMLCRWAQDFGSRGVGVDISEVFVTAARSRAETLGVADRVVIEHGDAQTFEPGEMARANHEAHALVRLSCTSTACQPPI